MDLHRRQLPATQFGSEWPSTRLLQRPTTIFDPASPLDCALRAETSPIETIILLGESGPIGTLAGFLRCRNARQNVITVESRGELEKIRARQLRKARLVAFASTVIVPSAILDALGFGAYNFHPGPPNYPGVAPQLFAVYDGAKVFGSTVHRMVEKVDEGPIVEVELFPVSSGITGKELALRNAPVMFRLFFRLSLWLTAYPDPLPTKPIAWSGRRRTRADLAAFCDFPDDIDERERARRNAAIGI